MIATEIDNLPIRVFEPATASDAEIAGANNLWNRQQAERQPEDPPHTMEQTRARLRSIPPFLDHTFWAVWNPDETEMVGYGLVMTFNTGEENQHWAQFEIGILPEWRRRGIGTRLLRHIFDAAVARDRRVIITQTYGSVPAGSEFISRVGAKVALESHENQLDIAADLDRSLLDRWIASGVERNPDMELGLWEGPYPEEELDAICKLLETTNTAPRGDLEVEDFHWTPELLRQQEAAREARNMECWTLYVRDRNNGELAGFTEIFRVPEKPAVLLQGFTAVWDHYRNRGLGRWLKAAMLDKVLRDYPQSRFVRTGNADSNAPMLKINNEMGFKPHQSEHVWQADIEQVRSYLESRGA